MVCADGFFGQHRGNKRDVLLDFGDSFHGFGNFAGLEVWAGVVKIEFGHYSTSFDAGW